MRAAGFNGFNCNLELVGQPRRRRQLAAALFSDERRAHLRLLRHGHRAAAARSLGVPVIDLTNPQRPEPTRSLSTTAMLDPWESLKVNERRQLLGAVNAANGGGGPEIDLYDLSGDCRFRSCWPALGRLTDGTTSCRRRERPRRQFRADGLTYYGGNSAPGTLPDRHHQYDQAEAACAIFHGAGRESMASPSATTATAATSRFAALERSPSEARPPGIAAEQRLQIFDTSDIQARKPNPQSQADRAPGVEGWRGAQHTIHVMINGKPYVIFVDEAGSGG